MARWLGAGFPDGTLFVNLSGAFIIGLVQELLPEVNRRMSSGLITTERVQVLHYENGDQL